MESTSATEEDHLLDSQQIKDLESVWKRKLIEQDIKLNHLKDVMDELSPSDVNIMLVELQRQNSCLYTDKRKIEKVK